MLKSSLCNYNDAYILVKGKITVNNTAAADVDANKTNRKVVFKNCAPFTNCMSEIKNPQVDNAKDIDIVIPMYNLIEYSFNHSKTSGGLWQYCQDVPAINNNDAIIDFNAVNNTSSFIFKAKITAQTRDVEIMVPLKYLSHFGGTIEISLTNCEINLILKWSENRVIVFTDVAN